MTIASVERECRRRPFLGRSGPSSAIGQNRVLHRSGTRSGLLVVSVCLDDCNIDIKLPRLTLIRPHVTLGHVFLLKAYFFDSSINCPSPSSAVLTNGLCSSDEPLMRVPGMWKSWQLPQRSKLGRQISPPTSGQGPHGCLVELICELCRDLRTWLGCVVALGNCRLALKPHQRQQARSKKPDSFCPYGKRVSIESRQGLSGLSAHGCHSEIV